MSNLDYAIFGHPSFEANEYANAILAGQTYRLSTTGTGPNDSSATVKPTAISNTTGNQSANEDISIALAKLSFGIDDVGRQLKNVINVHHEALLFRAASVNQLDGSLTHVNSRLGDIASSVTRLRTKLSLPYTSLQTHVTRLRKLQVASNVLRRVARFFMLSRRLESQMALISRLSTMSPVKVKSNNKAASGTRKDTITSPGSISEKEVETEKEREITIIKAALSVAEIFSLIDAEPSASEGIFDNQVLQVIEGGDKSTPEMDVVIPPISLRSINAVSSHIPVVQAAREQIVTEMENMLIVGVQELNRPLLSSALVTAHNLRILPETVQSLLNSLIEVVEQRVKAAFDMASLSKDAGLKSDGSLGSLGSGVAGVSAAASNLLYKSRVRTEPTSLTAPQWTNAFWTRLEGMIGDLGEACIKVYTLEKVLLLQRDANTGVIFLDEAMKVLENKPSATFWSTLARTLERTCREGAKSSTFLSQTLTSQYPRLLRLFHDFFSRISLHTDTIYTQDQQSPETVLTLRAISTLESLYLQRSNTRLNELINSSFANSASVYFGGTYPSGYAVNAVAGKAPPGEKEGISIARVVTNELDTAKFDPLLVKSAARGVVKSLETMCTKVDNLIIKDRSATTLIGPTATMQQVLNASLTNCLYHCWLMLSKIPEGYSESVNMILQPAISGVEALYNTITDPVLGSIRLDLSSIISRVHRVDLGDGGDAMARGMGGSSGFMKELANKLAFVRVELLSKYNLGDLGQEWGLDIARHILRTFILHASIAKPLGESGKLQLTTDMTELEFALSSLLAEGVAQGASKQRWKLDVLGMDFRALRAFRPLLFLDNESLSDHNQTVGLPPLIVLHHILVRSPLPLPHKLHGWQEVQYIRFVEEHTDEEVWGVIEQGLKHWRTTVLSEIEDAEEAGERGLHKKNEKEEELRIGDGFVGLAIKVLEYARAHNL